MRSPQTNPGYTSSDLYNQGWGSFIHRTFLRDPSLLSNSIFCPCSRFSSQQWRQLMLNTDALSAASPGPPTTRLWSEPFLPLAISLNRRSVCRRRELGSDSIRLCDAKIWSDLICSVCVTWFSLLLYETDSFITLSHKSVRSSSALLPKGEDRSVL